MHFSFFFCFSAYQIITFIFYLFNPFHTGFLQKDIVTDGDNGTRRHILFGTTNQLDVLARAKRWYIDRTFSIFRRPFYQLFTVHSFVTKDGGQSTCDCATPSCQAKKQMTI